MRKKVVVLSILICLLFVKRGLRIKDRKSCFPLKTAIQILSLKASYIESTNLLHMKKLLLLGLCLLSLQLFAQKEKRTQFLEELKPFLEASTGSWGSKAWVSPLDSNWQAWLDRTGELPPDFDIIPTQVLPHDLMKDLVTEDDITSKEQWKRQRRLMADLLYRLRNTSTR